MHYLGEEGYLRLAKKTLDTSDAILDGIRAIPELRVLGDPAMSVFAFTSDAIDVYALGDAMERARLARSIASSARRRST